MKFEFSRLSATVRKARLHVVVTKGVQFLGWTLAGLAMVVGLGLWATQSVVVGSFVIAIGLVIAVPLMWIKYDVDKIRPDLGLATNGQTVHMQGALSLSVLGHVHDMKSPYSLWKAIKGSWYQRVFCMRFGLPVELFEQISKDADEQQMNSILSLAHELSVKYALNEMSPVAIMIALLRSLPDAENTLASLSLDFDNIEEGVRWVHNEYAAIEGLGKHDHVGGLARDWTHGFTPTLNKMANDVTEHIERGGLSHISVDTHESTIAEIINNLLQPRSNALLVGDVGSGKTTTVYGLAKRLVNDKTLPESIRYYKVYQVDASAIINSSKDSEHVELTLYSVVAEAQRAKDIVLFFDNAVDLFSSGNGATDLSRALLDIIKNGSNPIVLAMTPTEWQQISANHQELAGLVSMLTVPEADDVHTMAVLQDHCLQLEARNKVIITYKALRDCINLSDRYVHDVVLPGKAVSLLEGAVGHAEGNVVTERSVQQTIEAIYGVKVQVADAKEGKELLKLEDQIHKRMINQTRAVKVVSDALRRARSGVGNPDKPIGTFLFLGPTGVGKTELAKALAQTYFGDESKMARVDMNEYTQSSDLARLLDVSTTSSLLSEVGRNRFTVVLFDEIEKAHPDVVNAFLQLLDEGEMRDVNNRVVSFRDAIVIATSNAGADRIRQYIDKGWELEQFEQKFVNELIDGGQFKPEFLNRFDETVVFRPLKAEELMQVVDLLIASVNRILERKKVSVVLSDDAKRWLVDNGNDPRLGARPLKRMVQRTVENIVARKMLTGELQPGAHVNLSAAELESEQSSTSK